MLDATFSVMEQSLMEALGAGQRPTRIGNRHPSMAPFDTFQCQDEPIAICCGNDHLFGLLADTLELDDLPRDPRFATNVDRTDNQASLKKSLEDRLQAETAETWHERLQEAGVPSSLILNIDDTRRLEQIKARAMVKEVGGFSVPGSPMKWARGTRWARCCPRPPGRARRGPAR